MAMTIGGFSGLLWYLYNPLSNIYETVGGLLSNGQDTGIAAIGTAVQAAPFVRAISMLLIVRLRTHVRISCTG